MIELITRRRVNIGKALPYDAEVTYLQSDGMAYIDTVYTPVQDDEVYIEFQVLNSFTAGEWAALFSAGTGTYQLICLPGKQYGNNALNFAVRYFRNSSGLTRMYANGAASQDFGKWKSITVDSTGTWSWNGKTTTGAYQNALDGNNTTLYLFMHRDGTLGISARIRKFIVTNGNATKLNLIPVRKETVGYMYDKVSGELFGNAAASGAFIYGNDV